MLPDDEGRTQIKKWAFAYRTMIKATCVVCGYVQEKDENHWCPMELWEEYWKNNPPEWRE